jgi:hypothetical protein
MHTRTLIIAAFVAALGARDVAAQQPENKPVTPATVAKATEKESKRAANKTGKTVRKAGKDTEKQAKRAAKGVKKVYSRKARKEAKGDTTTTPNPAPGAPR